MVVFRPGLKLLVLESVALDHLSGYEWRDYVASSCSICKPKPIIALSYRRMMFWLHAPAHPSVLSCAAELSLHCVIPASQDIQGHGYGSDRSFWQGGRTKHFKRNNCFLCMKKSRRSRAK